MARAISQQQFGPQDVSEAVSLVKLSKPEGAKAGHVLVRITTRPVHPFDLVMIRGSFLLQFAQGYRSVDIVPGIEGAGVVEEVGDGVKGLKPGDRVVPILLWEVLGQGRGSWQEYVEVSAKDVVLVPDEISDEDAAQFVSNPWTAYCLLKDLTAPKESYILLNAAASVLGRMIIPLAKHWGIKTISLVRREELKEELKSLGADEVLNEATEDVGAKIKELTDGKGVEAAIDMLGGSHTKTIAACVKDNGKLFSIGALDSSDAVISVNDLARKVKFEFWSLADAARDRKHKIAGQVMDLLKAKIIQPLPPAAKFSLEDFVKAVEASEAPARGGKVLLVNEL